MKLIKLFFILLLIVSFVVYCMSIVSCFVYLDKLGLKDYLFADYIFLFVVAVSFIELLVVFLLLGKQSQKAEEARVNFIDSMSKYLSKNYDAK